MEADFGAVEPAGDAVDRQNGEADARLIDAEVAEAHRKGSHHGAVEDAAPPVVGAGVRLIEQEDSAEEHRARQHLVAHTAQAEHKARRKGGCSFAGSASRTPSVTMTT